MTLPRLILPNWRLSLTKKDLQFHRVIYHDSSRRENIFPRKKAEM
jgi:hypothetical protein